MESQANHITVDSRRESGAGVAIAFQPIVDVSSRRVYAQEAIVRGRDGETREALLQQVPEEARRDFDRRCAAAAIRWAMAAGLGTGGARLMLPITAGLIGNPADYLAPILTTAKTVGLIPERLLFALHGYAALRGSDIADILDQFGKLGPAVIFVGLGEGQSELGTCGRYLPYAVKLEPELVSGIDGSWSRRIVLEDLGPRLRSLGLKAITPGVSNEGVAEKLRKLGFYLMQGDHFAPAEVGVLPVPNLRRAA